MSSRRRTGRILLVAAMLGAVGLIGHASAAPKQQLTFEQAWQKCKALLDKEGAYGTTTQSNWRTTRGGACMKHYGYNL
jgi:hypothetical protein